LSNLATKADHGVLRSEFEGLRGGVEALRDEFATLRGDLSAFRGEVAAKIERAKTELIKWVVGMGLAQVAMLIALLKLIPKAHP
jgi:hypothetical protein